jgi:gluconolactonase
MKSWSLILCALNLVCGSLVARASSDLTIVRLDPSLDLIVAKDAKLQEVYQRDDTTFEGPTWIHNGGSGYLIFTDVPGNAIDKLNPDGSVSVYLDNIFVGKDSDAFFSFGLNGQKKLKMLGPNGATLDPQGRVVYCELSDGQVVRVEKDGHRTVLASQFEGKRFNRANDLVYKSDGSLYFTDSGKSEKRSDGEGVPHKGLYRLKDGQVRLMSKDIDHPNGLAFSRDEKYLYVTNSLLKNVLRFDVQPDGGLANVEVFTDMSSDTRNGLPDGIKLDRKGNVYSTGPGGLWIMSPEGKHIGTILTPKQVNNLVFGGNDRKTLYLAGFGSVYRISMRVAGK